MESWGQKRDIREKLKKSEKKKMRTLVDNNVSMTNVIVTHGRC